MEITNWLQIYLEDSVSKNLCTDSHCTTCGARDFRKGVLRALTQASHRGFSDKPEREYNLEIAKALARVVRPQDNERKFEAAIRCLLVDMWSGLPFLDNEIEGLLPGSWAGDILRLMQEHQKARIEAIRAREEFERPENVRRRREEKKRIKREQHQKRLELKKERDRIRRKMMNTDAGN